ncbi:MAG: OmpA family protein [Saprospiraceae bacterium]|nr:OmpA family protein [Saprospiraceae bacterium]MDW8483304.1 OmpA family protein [Saprospiraceae bacterium]
MLKAAKQAQEEGNPYAAVEFYEKTYQETKDPALNPLIARLYFELRDYQRAERLLSRIVLRDRRNMYPELKFLYGLTLKYNGKYADAEEIFNQVISDNLDSALVARSKLEIAGCALGRKAKQPETLKVINVGKKINSPQTEASPWYSNGELYFASMAASEVIVLDGKEGDWYTKIYMTKPPTQPSVEYPEAKALNTRINREGWHQGNVSISPDGKTMYFTRQQMQGNYISTSKIYYALKGEDGWGAANEVAGVNGDYIAKHPCEGELYGEKVLFFAADMPGGRGGFDLYYAPKKRDGVFGLPVNLGPVINTPGDEVSPFYQDGKLYFSSNGHPSLGGLDVFVSEWDGSRWSPPQPLPAGINTSLDDLHYMRLPDGYSGYLVSNRPGINNLKSKTCCDDIYFWEMERIKVDLLATTFRLRKKDEKTNPPLEGCTVQVIDMTENSPLNVDAKTNPAGNDFSFTLLPDRSYLVIADRDGFLPDTVRFNTIGIKKSTKIEKKLTLRTKQPPKPRIVRRDEPIRLNNIYYDFDKADILPDAEKDLQFLVDLMNKYPDMKIELSSHTDAQGSDEYNERLSQRRAESAKNWMVARGIAPERIVAVGYGERFILNHCKNNVKCTDEEHRFNRRTEFKIIAGPTSITIEEEVKEEGQ